MRVTYKQIILYSLVLLSAIIFCNLNAVVTKIVGITAPTSPLILLLSSLIVGFGLFAIDVNINKLLYKGSMLFFFSFLTIGLLNLMWDDSLLAPGFSIRKVVRAYIPSVIIITAYYVGFSALQKMDSKFSIITFLVPFFIFSVGIMIFGPMLGLFDAFKIGVDEARSSGFFANPNDAGAAANYALVVFIALFIYTNKKLLVIPLIIMAIVASFYSFSKASILMSVGILVMLIVWSVTALTRNKRKTNLYMLVFVGLIYLSAQLVYLNFDNIMSDLTYAQRTRVKLVLALAGGKIDSSTTSDRSKVFRIGFDMIEKNPVLGSGLGTFHKLRNSLVQIGVHNTIIMIWGEAGVFVLLLFLMVFLVLFISGWWHPSPSYSFLIIGIIAVFIINVCGTGHNGLENRTSNAFWGICLMLVYHRRGLN